MWEFDALSLAALMIICTCTELLCVCETHDHRNAPDHVVRYHAHTKHELD